MHEIGGDLERALDKELIKGIVDTPDLIGCVLRVHFCLEEILNLWCNKVTSTDNLFDTGSFINFDTKLAIAKNLGLPADIANVFKQINIIRNKYAHRSAYILEENVLNSLKDNVDKIITPEKMDKIESFSIHPTIAFGQAVKVTWKEADIRLKFILVYFVFLIKLIHRLQLEFFNRNIPYSFRAATMK